MDSPTRSFGKYVFVLGAIFMAVSCSRPVSDSDDDGPESARRMIREANLETAHCGVLVLDVATGETALGLNSGRLFTPASTMKLMTTYAALLQLGADYRFETTLWVPETNAEPGVVTHVVLRGGGDPFLGDREWEKNAPAAFDSLASALAARGVTKIAGDLVVDASLYGSDIIPAGWSWGHLDKFYCAPVSSMNAGHNVVIVDIRPGTDAGSPARVRIEPDLPSHIALETSAVTAAGNRRAVSARLHREAGTMEVTGILGLKRENARLAVAVSDPARYAGLWFRRALVRYGIECGGEIRVTYEPTDFTTHVRAAAHFSDPLAEIAKRILDESDNLGAECLARHLAIATAGEPATGGSPAEETGALAILRERGLPAGPPVRIDDGSGLSRTSLLAPSHLTWALIEATKEDDFVFAGVVPLAEGHRKLGTHPMADEHRARIRAKTGSFQGTRCLAGYYTDADDAPLYAFAIMVNGLPADDDQAFAFEALVIDAVSKIAARHDRP